MTRLVGTETLLGSPEDMRLDKPVEPGTVVLWRHTRNEVFGPALEGSFQKGFRFLVKVPHLQVVDDGEVVDELATVRLDLVPACVVEQIDGAARN